MRIAQLFKIGVAVSLAAFLLALVTPQVRTQNEGVPGAKSLRLDGQESYVVIPYSADLNPTEAITIEAWVKPDRNACETIVGNGFLESYWLGLCSYPRFYYGNGRTIGDGTTLPTPGEWNHVAVTFVSQTSSPDFGYYLNGESSSVNIALRPADADQPLFIGGDRSEGEYFFQGLIDEVRIWSVARTAEEIAADMGRELDESAPGLVAVWHFNGDTLDAVGGHHGILLGNATFSDESFPASEEE